MQPSPNLSKPQYSRQEILVELKALLTGRWITDLSNTAALFMNHIPNINWVGFYLVPADNPETLWLGPFQGLPACTEIKFTKGVCGTAAAQKKTIIVKDVDQFPGHIVCDSRSKSELVVPLIKNNKVIGVLDIDSAELNRFNEEDQKFFEAAVEILLTTANPV